MGPADQVGGEARVGSCAGGFAAGAGLAAGAWLAAGAGLAVELAGEAWSAGAAAAWPLADEAIAKPKRHKNRHARDIRTLGLLRLDMASNAANLA